MTAIVITPNVRESTFHVPADSGTYEQDSNLDENVGKITADVQSAKLKQLLGQIKQS